MKARYVHRRKPIREGSRTPGSFRKKHKSSAEFLINASANGAATKIEGGKDMLGWSLTFLVLALLAALFGFGGIAAASAGIAKILFIVFIVLFLASLLFRGFGRVP